MGKVQYEALRGGNYREGGEEAVAGEVYADIPEHLVPDLTARRAIKALAGQEEPRSRWSVERLQAEVDARELTVEGTGAGGNVIKDDLIKALEADDEAKEEV